MEDGKLLKMKLLNTESDGLEHRFNLEAAGGNRGKQRDRGQPDHDPAL